MSEGTIVILGGTGPAGRGLAARLAAVGRTVLLGSRDVEKATVVTRSLCERWQLPAAGLRPSTNREAAESGHLVLICTAAGAAAPTAAEHAGALSGKVVVSIANAMTRTNGEFRPVFVPEGSVALAVQAAVPDALVVATLHHVPAASLAALDRSLVGDVVVVAEHERAMAETHRLITALKDLRPFNGGSLANAVALEMFCAAIVTVNLHTKAEVTLRLVSASDPLPGDGARGSSAGGEAHAALAHPVSERCLVPARGDDPDQ